MRSVSLYDSKIYSIILLRVSPDLEKELLSAIRREAPSIGDAKMDISFKSGWAVIELQKDASSSDKDFNEISPEYLKMKYDEIISVTRRIMDKIGKFSREGCVPHRYTLLTNGSRDNVWLKTYSDMTFLYKDKKTDQPEILQTNISYLNRIILGKGEVIVNSIRHGKVGASLYLLGSSAQISDGRFPTDMVLEINISDVKTSSAYGDGPINVAGSSPYAGGDGPEKKLYQTRQNYLINLLAVKSKLMELLMVQSGFIDMKNNEMKKVGDRGKGLKEDIYQLQNDINEHMKLYIPSSSEKKRKKKDKDFLARESYHKEKQLLTTASVRFSLVSEVEHEIMRNSSILLEMDQRTRDAINSLSLESQDIAIEGMGFSLGEMTLKEMEKDRRDLVTLLDELSHSRDILSSTIEVLRTFIDTRQREVSEDMSRLMNLLFLVFACIGLADALGNFVILVLDRGYLSNDPSLMEVIQYGSFGMMVTLLPLLIAAIFLYLFFKKKD